MKKEIGVSAKVTFSRERRFYGPGIQELLEGVDTYGSVKMACTQMGLSYTKGWRILKTAENGFGFPLVVRHQGGSGGGATSLTPEAKKIVGLYNELDGEIAAYAQARFAEKFADLLSEDH